jgi:hypothetical protein
MSFFEVLKGIIKKLNFYRSTFFWQDDNHKKKVLGGKMGFLCGGINIKIWSEFLEEHNDFKALESRWRLLYDDSNSTCNMTQ